MTDAYVHHKPHHNPHRNQRYQYLHELHMKFVTTNVIAVAAIGLLVLLAILVRTHEWYTPASDFGYYLGMAGGLMMLALFVYPLKKRIGFLRRFGATKPWFVFHMICGIVGPIAVIFHSAFQINSQNALVAMLSMLLVAGSGIVGRYIYVRIFDNLNGHELRLDQLQGSVDSESINFSRDMHWAADVVATLTTFRVDALSPSRLGPAQMIYVLALPFRKWNVQHQCHAALKAHLRTRAVARGWDAAKLKKRQRQFDRLIAHYIETVQRAAQYSVYQRFFSWWHVLHIPFVYLLVASAIYHVIAVHMY